MTIFQAIILLFYSSRAFYDWFYHTVKVQGVYLCFFYRYAYALSTVSILCPTCVHYNMECPPHPSKKIDLAMMPDHHGYDVTLQLIHTYKENKNWTKRHMVLYGFCSTSIAPVKDAAHQIIVGVSEYIHGLP